MTVGERIPDRRSVVSWVVYDLANTIFALGVVGFYFSDWLISVDLRDSALAAVQIAASIVVIFVAPWAGARSDVRGARVPTLIVTTIIAVAATALLAIGPIILTLVMLWIAVIAVNTGSVVYDALLTDVSTTENRGWISGLGVGVGYLGSFLGLGIGYVTLEVAGWSHGATFRSIAVAFLLFAIPSFLFIRERQGSSNAPLPGVRDIAARIITSWRLARSYEGVARFLVGRFLYTDAINTLISGFLAIFILDELGLDNDFFTALMAVAIAAAVVGGLVTGRFVARVGPIRVLRGVLVMWMLALAAGVTAGVTGITAIAWVIGPVGGIALGATWAADRVVMITISPPRHLGEFYGLYATVGRFATIAGPLAWAIVVDVLRIGRSAALAVLILFVGIALWVLRKVDDSPRTWRPEDQLVFSENPGPSPT